MDEDIKRHFKEFMKRCYTKLEAAQDERKRNYRELDLFEELTQELVDISNYAFLQHVKLLQIKKKMTKLQNRSNKD